MGRENERGAMKKNLKPTSSLLFVLCRSKDIEVGSCAAFLEIKVQATVVEYLIRNVDIIFNDKLLPEGAGEETSQFLLSNSFQIPSNKALHYSHIHVAVIVWI